MWCHGWVEEEECRAVALRLSRHFGENVAIGIVWADSSPVEWTHRPSWATAERIEHFLEKNGCKPRPRGLGSSHASGSHTGSTSRASRPKVSNQRATAAGLRGRIKIMASKIEVTVAGNKGETMAAAEKAVDAYFDGLKAQSEKVCNAAKALFARFADKKRLPATALVQGIAIELGFPEDLSTDMIISILKTAGFVGAGERGPKGIGLPGTTDEAPVAAATQAAPAPAPNGSTSGAGKKDGGKPAAQASASK